MLLWDLYEHGSDQGSVHGQPERKPHTGVSVKYRVELLHQLVYGYLFEVQVHLTASLSWVSHFHDLHSDSSYDILAFVLHGEVLWGMPWWDLYACGSDQGFVHGRPERKSCTGKFGKCSVELLHYCDE